MELNTLEVAVVHAAVEGVEQAAKADLSELQLAMIGGGCGDPIFI